MRPPIFSRTLGIAAGVAALTAAFGCGNSNNDAQTQKPAAHPEIAAGDTSSLSGSAINYNRDIRPILADKCFACHGPDSASREEDLRLDIPEDGDEYFGAMSVIEPGDAEASVLVSRIHSTRARRVMPPAEFNVTLSDQEKQMLVDWINQGAGYERHWAFVPPPETVEIPDVVNEDWPRGDIDRFVLSQLEQAGMTPSQEASRVRWLRRVSYDLTGLPPTPQEIDAFVLDDADDAHERVVDRLLASTHFGERMAVPWLDLARYADTYGYSVDGFRASWPWRDWLIKAYNDNLPYDVFLTWQLAGDLLPDATREQELATAFNRLHRMNAEGGAIREEWRNEYVADRLHTFGTAFLGLTFECARCHDHKYDPIAQREYYELFAFFNSIDESGTTEYHRADIIPPPSLLLPNESQMQRLQQLGEEALQAQRRLDEKIAERTTAFQQWLADPQFPDVMPEMVGDYSFDEIAGGNQLPNRIEGGAVGYIAKHESLRMPTLSPGVVGQAIALDGDNLAHLPGVSDLDRWTPFTIALWFKVEALDEGSPRVIVHRTSGTDVGPYGFDLVLDGGALMARAYRHWPGNAIAVRVDDAVKPGQWVHVVWRYDGSSRAAGMVLSVNGKVAAAEVVRDGALLKTVGGGHPYGPGGHDLIVGQRFRDRGLSGGSVDEVRIIRRAVSDLEALQLFDASAVSDAISNQEEASLRGYYFSSIDPETRAATDALRTAREQFVKHENSIAEIAVMREMPEPRPAHILNRGLYDALRSEDNLVIRDVPESVMPWIEGSPRNRLGLSQWLTDLSHPLTSRIAVNRLWQQCFGTGLVATSDNFGMQGSAPTHPELLDYLARLFIDSGWDTKAMLKGIVLSATYRQDSATSPEQWREDPGNAMLARGPSRRLEAEMIRDTALSASGLLARKVGGASVNPYQPAGLWEEVSGAGYRVGSGEALYRRSLYTIWKRAVPMPNMMAFDTPTREACSAQRAATNTPLQALVLLNDVQYVEAARVLAQRIMLEREGDIERITLGVRLLTGEPPNEYQMTCLVSLLASQREIFADRPDDAQALLAMGASPRDESIDAAEHAAMMIVMHAVLNLDAAIWLR